jgi:hypothetical protein
MRYFENVVIPAIDLSNSTGHCPELRKRFDVTTPTCNEYENLRKTVSGIPVGYSRKEGEDDETSRYKGSKWGYLERIIEERDRNERREPQ